MLQLPPSAPSPDSNEVRHVGNVEVRPAELQVLIDGVRVGLTVREFQLFLVLVQRNDRVVTRTEEEARLARTPRRIGEPPAAPA